MNLSRSDLNSELFDLCQKKINNLLTSEIPCIFWSFHEAPLEFQKLCNFNGGDEDYLILMKGNPEHDPYFVERLAVFDYYRYNLDNSTIFVLSHS